MFTYKLSDSLCPTLTQRVYSATAVAGGDKYGDEHVGLVFFHNFFGIFS